MALGESISLHPNTLQDYGKFLVDFSCVRLIIIDIYTSGPFSFASISSRATQDYVPMTQWVEILKHTHQFANAAPSLNLPDYTDPLSSLHQIVSNDASD